MSASFFCHWYASGAAPDAAHAERHRMPRRDQLTGGILRDHRGVAAGIDHLEHRAHAPREVEQVPVIVHVDVHRRADPRCEIGHGQGVEVDTPDEVAAVVGKEIVPDVIRRELRRLRVVEVAARDRAGRRVSRVAVIREGIRVERIVAGRRGPLQERPLAGGPAVVQPRLLVVDLFPRVLTDVVDEDAPREGLHPEREGIAMAERPDLVAGRRRVADERVVVGDRAVGIQPQDLAEEVVERLGVGRDSRSRPPRCRSFRPTRSAALPRCGSSRKTGYSAPGESARCRRPRRLRCP